MPVLKALRAFRTTNSLYKTDMGKKLLLRGGDLSAKILHMMNGEVEKNTLDNAIVTAGNSDEANVQRTTQFPQLPSY